MSDWKLWGKYGTTIQRDGPTPPRFYLIPLLQPTDDEGPLAAQLGHFLRAPSAPVTNLDSITAELDRAVSGEYDGVIFPGSFFSDLIASTLRDDVVRRCRARELRVVFQVTAHSLVSENAHMLLEELMRRLDAGDALNFVFGDGALPKDSWLARLARWPEQVYFTYSVRKKDPVIETLHRLQPFVRERLFFHFPYHLAFGDNHLSCHEVFQLVERIHSRVPGIRVRPQYGCENYDPRVDPTLESEPLYGPRWAHFVHNKRHLAESNEPIEISVIIPTYNNRDYVLNTVRHLRRQTMDRRQFEVIVVDDGSNDGTEEALRQDLYGEENQFNFKYIYSPRLKPRKMGDANYRAGISRNLGVKNSRGRILCFLDSDILTPENYLSELLLQHQDFDVIQCKRLNLTQEKSNASIRYNDIDVRTDIFSTEDGYWDRFHSLSEWSSAPFFWKYTCTYGLSVPTALFKKVGWIKRGFVFYGFEDVELGYRLAHAGARFHLSPATTYHLFHKTERSEFRNSDYLRQSLLAKTAQIFYLGLLEKDVFIHFRGLMKEQNPLATFVSALMKRLGIHIIPRFLTEVGLALHNRRWFMWHLVQKLKHISGMDFSWSARLQLWRIPVVAGRISAAVPFWKVRVLGERCLSRLELWRVPILFGRAA
ncbi:MAG: glycosyltransferase family 2 protein, partial [Bdellovibrionaceae bacterium]|nr:glycosyltransferase family 2 protein [Pseudobdellovibrionaceae bacterium]